MLYLFKITVKGSRDEILSERLYYTDVITVKEIAKKIIDCCDVGTCVYIEKCDSKQYIFDKVLESSKVL